MNRFIALALLAASIPLTGAYGDTVYKLTFPAPFSESITGTITTDGTIGTITAAEVVSFSLTVGAPSSQWQQTITEASAGLSIRIANVIATNDTLTLAADTIATDDYREGRGEFYVRKYEDFQNPGVYNRYEITAINIAHNVRSLPTGDRSAVELSIHDYLFHKPSIITGAQITGTSPRVIAVAIPEPSAFLSLGLLGLGLATRSRVSRCRSTAA